MPSLGNLTQYKTWNITTPGSEASAPWSGYKTPQLKPAWEPILCFRAPNQGKKYAELALEHGSGALNVEEGRVGVNGGTETVVPAPKGSAASNCYGKGIHGHKSAAIPGLGRYPANLVLDKDTGKMLGTQPITQPLSRPMGLMSGDIGEFYSNGTRGQAPGFQSRLSVQPVGTENPPRVSPKPIDTSLSPLGERARALIKKINAESNAKLARELQKDIEGN
jgi:hypothetical protein